MVFILFKKIIGVVCALLTFIFLFFFAGFLIITIFPDYSFNFIISLFLFIILGSVSKSVYRFIANWGENNESTNFEPNNYGLKSGENYKTLPIKSKKPGFPIKDNFQNIPIENNISEKKKRTLINKRIFIFLVLIFLVIVGSYFLIDTIDQNNKILEVSHFNDSKISFDYPSIWNKYEDKDFYLNLKGNGIAFNLDITDTMGLSIDEIANNIFNDINVSNVDILYKNTTIVEGRKAYDIGLNVNQDGEFQSRILFFVVNDKLYIFRFSSDKIENIDNSFNLVKKSIKIK